MASERLLCIEGTSAHWARNILSNFELPRRELEEAGGYARAQPPVISGKTVFIGSVKLCGNQEIEREEKGQWRLTTSQKGL
jgi:hypothetical protein